MVGKPVSVPPPKSTYLSKSSSSILEDWKYGSLEVSCYYLTRLEVLKDCGGSNRASPIPPQSTAGPEAQRHRGLEAWGELFLISTAF